MRALNNDYSTSNAIGNPRSSGPPRGRIRSYAQVCLAISLLHLWAAYCEVMQWHFVILSAMTEVCFALAYVSISRVHTDPVGSALENAPGDSSGEAGASQLSGTSSPPQGPGESVPYTEDEINECAYIAEGNPNFED
ncbi:hypothetical protein [Aquisphaera insulae]|uniref:hypothetical protein n=1 Tax=Aquisphaera insulae TaxID=2712864 RepID=UPI0013EBBA14|nr:hypothetical protein [Aquisphaera insulae]